MVMYYGNVYGNVYDNVMTISNADQWRNKFIFKKSHFYKAIILKAAYFTHSLELPILYVQIVPPIQAKYLT